MPIAFEGERSEGGAPVNVAFAPLDPGDEGILEEAAGAFDRPSMREELAVGR